MLWLLLLQVWASCLWLGQGKVVTSFANTCDQFFYQNMPATKGLEPQHPAWICQTYQNQSFYATLYDKQRRIPVYSAYIYKRETGERVTVQWMVEPQLIRSDLSINMQNVRTLKNQYHVTTQEIRASQAVSEDYKGSDYDRGHLNPSGQHNSSISKNATFTLTNAVPMNLTLNRGNWKNYEQDTMWNKTQNCPTTYVIVGAVPGTSSLNDGRVNIPSHIWASACCKNTSNHMIAWGAIAQNNQSQVDILNLGELERRLTQLYDRGPVSLFHAGCPRI